MARPEGREIARLLPLGAKGQAAFGLYGWAYSVTPVDVRQMASEGATVATCLVMFPILSILQQATVLYALHRGATTAPARAGFVAGLAGSSLAAAICALHCTEDSALFYLTW